MPVPCLPARTALAAVFALALASGVCASPAQIAAAPPSATTIDAARANPNLVILRAGVFDPVAQTLDVRAVGAATVASSDYAIVQFLPGRLAARQALAAQGAEFLGYVPNNAYYVRLHGLSLDRVRGQAGVRWAGADAPALKLDPTLWQAARRSSVARQWDGSYEVQLDAFAGAAPAAIVAALEKMVPGATITGRSERAQAGQYVRAAVSVDRLDALLAAATAIDGVEFVSPWIQPRVTNSGAIGAIQGDSQSKCSGSGSVCGPTPIWDHGLFGSGQIIAISDSGTDANEAWFTTLDKGAGPHTEITFADSPPPTLPNIGTLHRNNKIIGYWVQPGATAYDNDFDCQNPPNHTFVWHGTHTSGTLVGDAAGTFGTATYTASTPTSAGHDLADGMAPNAQLLQQDIGNDSTGCLAINDFRGTLQQAVAAGAHIHSDSWGASDSGAYDSDDNNVDYATNTLEDLLVVVAAGNDGHSSISIGTIGSPGNAKNALTVGALGHAGSPNVASFSSGGPTADGRLKPDIMAPGTSTVSAAGDSNTDTTIEAPQIQALSGTSMATPTIAGNAALMRQFFTDGFYPRGAKTAADAYNPSGMAMKAFLLNGTNVLQTSWPNNTIGWGRAWLDGNLWFANTLTGGNDARRSRLFERTNAAGLQTGESHTYTIADVQAGAELRATLTWFDPEASVGAASTLVNNLDLEVIGPGGTYKGNVFNVSGVSVTGGSADATNTVEQVRLTAPTAGSYTFRVIGTSIPGNGRAQTDRQGYALVVSGAFGLPDAAAFVAPTGLSVAGNDLNGVRIAFSAAGGAQGFQLYRANGTCASAQAGDFRMVATSASSPLIDDRTQGGFSYAYKVRGVSNDVEGDVSACIDVVSQDSCTLQPAFDIASLNANGSNASCSIVLGWTPAQAACPASTGITYAVQRATQPDFSDGTTIATGLTSATYTDVAVANGQPYYYKVSAQDSFGNTAPASRTLNATPAGADGPNPATFLDDVDTHTYMSLETPWQITATSASSGTHSYHNAPDGQVYPDLTCASITTPPLKLVQGSTLKFMAKYDMEYEFDGVVMEISTDGGKNWTDLPPDGGYPDTFALTGNPAINACGYTATQGAFTGVSTKLLNNDPNNGSAAAVFKPFARDLSAYAGQTVRIRWRMSSDPATGYLGFLLDDVRIGTDLIFADGFEAPLPGTDYVCH